MQAKIIFGPFLLTSTKDPTIYDTQITHAKLLAFLLMRYGTHLVCIRYYTHVYSSFNQLSKPFIYIHILLNGTHISLFVYGKSPQFAPFSMCCCLYTFGEVVRCIYCGYGIRERLLCSEFVLKEDCFPGRHGRENQKSGFFRFRICCKVSRWDMKRKYQFASPYSQL